MSPEAWAEAVLSEALVACSAAVVLAEALQAATEARAVPPGEGSSDSRSRCSRSLRCRTGTALRVHRRHSRSPKSMDGARTHDLVSEHVRPAAYAN